MGEAAYQRYCRNRAFAFIGAQPWAYGGLVLRRLGVFWLGDLWTAVEWRGGLRSSVPLLQVKKAANMLPLPFALAGLLVALRRRWRVWPLVVPILAYSVPFVLIYCAYGRYRVPIHGFLVLLASVALYAAWERLARGRRAKPGEGAT
jgi:hypothetical protein